ncbi:hypothetical protein FSP39_024902 [Pinctada imbricata]|uniref:C-type lectin domain-containing protein n=1 Tax=Pinctada imbricata TaxID=66713 RepID=A0AA89C9F0_PINIB|nr:hypothetical protein FSP39_024902 [Pinctada imbricata]
MHQITGGQGLNNQDPNSNTFVWGDGSPPNPAVTAGQQVYINANSHCVAVVKPGKLRNINCGVRHPYVCERARGIPLTCDADRGWQQYNNYCYKVHTDSQNWAQASKQCDRDGGSLVQIENEQDEIVIHDFAKNTKSPIWIGLRSMKYGTSPVSWVWTNGTTLDPTIAYWYNGRTPNLQANRINNTCVWMSNTLPDYHKSWRTDNCGSRKHYVCKRPEGVCAPGWVPHQRKCFQFNIRFKKSWRNAEAFCKAEGGHLIGIYSNTFLAFLNSYLDELRDAQISSIWIGLTDNNQDTGKFVWTAGGAPGKFQNWLHNPPPNTKSQLDCSYILTGDRSGKWRPTNNCNQQKAFICMANMGQRVRTVTTPRPQFTCPRGWRLHGGMCHLFVDHPTNWQNARTACQAKKADLATIRTPDMQTFIQSQLRGKEYWIGLSDRTREGQYFWLDESVRSKYYHWSQSNPKQPDNHNGQQNCVRIMTNGFWDDRECYAGLRYICQTVAMPFSRKCGLNWEEDPNSDWCYQFHDEQLIWSDARVVCINNHGDLASITSREEQFYIGTKVATMNSFGVWIGAQDWSKEGGWTWVDGSPFAYLNWASGQPDDFRHNEDCGAIWAQSTRWNDYPCSSRNGFICKKFSGYTVGCPQYWHQHGGACFVAIRKRLNWAQAQTLCRRNGAFLARIDSQDEQNFVRSLMPKTWNNTWEGFWIGLNDRVIDMKFQWSDGSPVLYTNWGLKEPNNWKHRREDCGMITIKSGGWNDGICTDASPGLVCRKPVTVVSITKAPENQGCSLPARGYGSYCYAIVAGQMKSWSDAQNDCIHRFHGNLATINNRYIQAFVSNYFPHNSDYFWNGMSDTQTQGTYKWISNQPVQFSYWDQSHTGNEIASCIAMRTSQPLGLWLNKNCSERHFYICESPRAGYTTPKTTPIPTSTPCPQNFTGFGGFCYKAYRFTSSKSKLTWEESRDYCRALGGDLISIHSQAEQDFVIHTLLNNSARYSGYWIGLNDRARESGHVWSDGTPTDFTTWSPHEPNDYNHNEDCVQVDMSTRKWNDNNCFFSMNYICKIARGVQIPTSVAPPTAATSAACGPGWVAYSSFCYMFATNMTKSWYDARTYCNSMGSELISIHSLDENNLIVGQATKQGRSNYWIGLNELQQHGTYLWSDNTVTDFTAWRPGEPNDAFGGERCTNFNIYGGTWNDNNCDAALPFICKRLSSSATKPVVTPAPALINGGCPNSNFVPVPKSNKCYAFVNGSKNWLDARNACRQNYQGSDIASINNINEQEFLTAHIKSYGYSMWIGLNKVNHNSKFFWQDNSQFSFENWAPNEPNSAPSGGKFVRNSEECVEMYIRVAQGPGKWNDKSCSVTRPYICQMMKNAASPVISQQGGCPSGFVSWGTSCYQYITTSTTWSSANQMCQQSSLSATLAVINDVYEDAYIQSLVGCPTCSYWIGLGDQQTSGTYSWVKNWPVYFTNWGAGEPTRAAGEGCVAITNNVWNDTDCNSNMGFVCEINTVNPPPTTPPPLGHCADSTQTIRGDYCYYFSRYKTSTWPGANYICQKLGMNLASIHDSGELNFVWNTFMNMVPMANESAKGSPAGVWIGMTKGLSDGFAWSDKTAVNYLNWNTGEPSDPLGASNEECVELYTNSGKWNDKDCFATRKYVCKGQALGITTRFKLTTQNIANLPVLTSKPNNTPQPIRPTVPVRPITNPVRPITNPVRPITNPVRPITNPILPPPTPGPTKGYPVLTFPPGGVARQQASRNSNNNSNNSSTSLSGGALAGILIACILIIIIVAFGTIFLKRRQAPPPMSPVEGIDNKMYFSSSEQSVKNSMGDADA